MPFGIQVRTTSGMSDLGDIDSIRLIYTTNRTALSGSISRSFPSNAIGFSIARDGKQPPTVTVTTTGLSWAEDSEEPSSNFTIQVFV